MASKAVEPIFVLRWYRSIRRFFKDAFAELREVVWPSWDELKHFTLLVIVVILAVSAWLGMFQFLFNWLAADVLDLYGAR